MPRTAQPRKNSSAIRPPFRTVAVLIGLVSVASAVVNWRSFPIFTAVMGLFFLIAGFGGDEGLGFLNRSVSGGVGAIVRVDLFRRYGRGSIRTAKFHKSA